MPLHKKAWILRYIPKYSYFIISMYR
jgi:hypothetical protein